MGFINWVKSRLRKKEEYHEIVIDVPKEQEDLATKAKRELYKELQNIGIFPKMKYYVGHVQVDFGFPNEKVAIEVIGNMKEDEVNENKKKYSTLKAFGWKVYGFSAENVYMNAKDTAIKIKKIIGYHKRGI